MMATETESQATATALALVTSMLDQDTQSTRILRCTTPDRDALIRHLVGLASHLVDRHDDRSHIELMRQVVARHILDDGVTA